MTNELAVTPKPTLSEQISIAEALAPSDIIPASYQGKPANIVVAMEFGQSMGLSPAESLYRINVIKGKPTMSAELVAAQVRKAGHKLRISKDVAHNSVTCTIVRADDPDHPFTVTRDATWAKQMGLTSKDNYQKQPLTMLTWRAITACAREACPEALFGAGYTPDEMHDFDSAPIEQSVTATVEPMPVAAQVEPVAQPQPAQEPAQPQQQQPQADLEPLRDLFQPYCAARKIIASDAMDEIAQAVGAASFKSMTQQQVNLAVQIMETTINSAPKTASNGGWESA